ncbi:hypothetical protein imdm_2375 [gamma proteobacterium IMCC2047]|nr:hypothetical protein imdm_2375 [gamma proteobacterium IMCC2047]
MFSCAHLDKHFSHNEVAECWHCFSLQRPFYVDWLAIKQHSMLKHSL